MGPRARLVKSEAPVGRGPGWRRGRGRTGGGAQFEGGTGAGLEAGPDWGRGLSRVCAGAGSGRALGQPGKHGLDAAAEQVSCGRGRGRAIGSPERAARGQGAAGPREPPGPALRTPLATALPGLRSPCAPRPRCGGGEREGAGEAAMGAAWNWGDRRSAGSCSKAQGLEPLGRVLGPAAAGWRRRGGWAQWALVKGI